MGQINLGLPIPGQPDSSEEAKIPSDFTIIQTLVNGNLDTNNLSPTAGIVPGQLAAGAMKWNPVAPIGSYSAAHGDCVDAPPGSTVTLPAPTAGAMVCVFGNGAVSGTSPVTIASGGLAASIFGVGMASGPTSFLLGTAVAPVVLVGIGTFWAIVAGRRDTGWVPIPPPTSWGTYPGYYAPATRLVGDTVTMRGVAQYTSAVAANYATTLAAQFRPTGTILTQAGFQITTAGVISVNTVSGYQSFDGLVYSLS
jgi:hypothetical protein